MENFLLRVPRFVLVLIAIVVGIVVFIFLNPMHSICDIEKITLSEKFKGVFWPLKEKNKKYPPQIVKLKDICLQGGSSGACFEYFSKLRSLSKFIQQSSEACASDLIDSVEVKKAVLDGLEIMPLMAWGDRPPDPGMGRVGWFLDYELSVFCSLKEAYRKAKGHDAWLGLVSKVSQKFPLGKSKDSPTAGINALENEQSEKIEFQSAVSVLGESEVWSRSIFSLKCDTYR